MADTIQKDLSNNTKKAAQTNYGLSTLINDNNNLETNSKVFSKNIINSSKSNEKLNYNNTLLEKTIQINNSTNISFETIKHNKENDLSNNNMEVNELNVNNENIDNINTKLYLLDPLSVIIKLAILSYKPIGTKLTIYNNIIYIQEPGFFQGLCRIVMQSNKNDLQYLYNPIYIACKYFLHPNYLKKISDIKKLFICAQNGIKKLMETYNKYILLNILLCYYYSLITNFIEDNYNNTLFYPDNLTNLYNNELVYNLNINWTNDKINVILDLITFLFKYKDNPNCKSLETIMDSFDNEYQKNIIKLL
jgi:hypothetical protein